MRTTPLPTLSRRTRVIVALTAPLLLAASVAGALISLRPGAHPAHAATLTGLKVQGNQLQSSSGQPVRFLGANLSGPEYACIQGWGIFDGPANATTVQAMTAWHINSVRVPLNEDCWLGINGVKSAYGGATYRQALVNYVNLLHQYGLYAEVSLMWSAPGTTRATYQREMPDSDHSVALWQSVASAFKDDPNVIFGVYGEPHGVGWACWKNGGSACANDGLSYSAAGMQSLVTAVRGTGATQPIAVPGIDYANNLSQWLQYQPNDPQHALVAEFHEYGDNTCASITCWNSQELPVLQQVPLLTGELGESVDGTCAHTFIDRYMSWADANGVSYQGWTWDTWGGCGVLITSSSGTPTSGFGQGYKAHLVAINPGGSTGAPAPATATATTGGAPTSTSTGSVATCNNPSIAFGASSATPASLSPGATVTFATTFTASCGGGSLVDFEVYNTSERKVWTKWWDYQTLTGQPQTYTAQWTLPTSQATGSYTFKVGIFSPAWTTLYAWNDSAATFQVAGAGSGTTPTPTSTPTSPPTSTGGGMLPPGATLPSEATCAAQVPASTWEPRPDNNTANHTVPTAQQIAAIQPWDPTIGMDQNSDSLRRQMTGNYTGTTDQILQWVACKWGIDPNIVRAQAEQESYWHMSQLGDWTSNTSVCPPDGVYTNGGCYQSYGILQIKYRYYKSAFPMARQDTALSAEYAMGWIRNCYEGWSDYLYQETPSAGYPKYHAGDIWGCVGFWFSGSWYDQGAINYIAQVKSHYTNKDWLKPGF